MFSQQTKNTSFILHFQNNLCCPVISDFCFDSTRLHASLSLSLSLLSTRLWVTSLRTSTPPHPPVDVTTNYPPPPTPRLSEAGVWGVEEKCTLSFYINTSSLTDKGRGLLPSFPNCKSSSSVLQGAEPTFMEA